MQVCLPFLSLSSCCFNIISAKNAIQAMNGFQMGGNTLTVKAANENSTGATTSDSIFSSLHPYPWSPPDLIYPHPLHCEL